MRTVGRTALVLVSLLSAGLSLTGCTPSDRPSTQSDVASEVPNPEASAPTTAASVTRPSGPPCQPDQFEVSGAAGERPRITVPTDCAPQDGLVVKDLTPGTGAEVKAGSTATVQYELVTFSNGEVRDSSWERGQPYAVKDVGNASVIEGWNQGLIGLKEGGRRLLVVPSELGYGSGGNGIAAGETLVFVIDAVKVEG
ncbi:FKBP-type peptidyl-prolyl cis-trans isomerase [Saccharothrix coeruleofusca]|uniref:Peptidyl-prolyl cis-trans isomerase n=1 Tax=Saccharothrix coeruleofusca TaxID=33919 RepID=A0A918AQB7_9PSEU|nr:FKBP-type peptidyl-prolyl cis-trans isomerase [Saccharothrix coeruleofusca]MBP2337767.1 peptidylprolyl isomerase [Saccharothrix coeruleofusca]GGP62145.1 peptidyl-prolyl cis-trans isomerase [Saccharothrix coeruleofusca]